MGGPSCKGSSVLIVGLFLALVNFKTSGAQDAKRGSFRPAATQYQGDVSEVRLNYHVSTIITCSGHSGAEVLVKGNGTARITKFLNGSVMISLPYTVEPVAPGPEVSGYKGRFGVKISGLQSGTLSDDMLDGNEFVFLLSEGSSDGELEIRFPASFNLQLRYAGESGHADFLFAPKIYLVNGSCSA